MKIIKPQKGFQEKFLKSRVDVVFGGGSAGSGKMQPYDAQVLTPFGFVDMGSLKIGSQIINPSGKTQRVIQIFEHGEQDVYKLFFSDGSSTESGLDHLWLVRNSRTKQKMANDAFFQDDNFFKGRIMTTREIIAFLDSQKQNPEKYNANYHLLVPLVKPIHFNCGERAKLLIHPYLLGVLIGDGCITGTSNISITSADPDIIDRVRALGYDVVKRGSSRGYDYGLKDPDGSIRKELTRLGIFGTRSNNKFLPKQCRWLSVEDKLLLMQGLMDTDGYVDAGGSMVYTTISKQLSIDIQWIVRSLGGKATIGTKEPTYTYRGEKRNGQLAYNIFINSPLNPDMVSLKRKKDRTSYLYNGGQAELANRIVRYEYAGRKECRCITVDNPNRLYVTDDFIVTHNTYASCLLPAYFYDNPQFRAVYVRRNLGELTAGGGLLDTLLDIYPKQMFARISETGSPVLQFQSGAELTLTHFADETPAKFNERVKGWQYPLVYLDELTAYEWSTFSTIMTRNRGSAGTIPMIRATCNPKRNSWVRRWLDWYIGEDGFIIPERDGVVRYFYMMGKDVDDVVWGSSKQEVYEKCKVDIDRKMNRVGKSAYITKESFIKSFVFYRGKISENEIVLRDNPNYLGSLAASGGAQAQQLLDGNWNVDEEDDVAAELSTEEIKTIFSSDPNTAGAKAITADIALRGDDNMVCLAWQGFHIIDKLVIQTTDAPKAIQAVKLFAARHDVPDRRIIFDGTAIGSFVGGDAGFIKGAIPFMGGSGAAGNPNYSNLKAQCADKLIAMIKSGLISCSPSVSSSEYRHKKIKTHMTFADRVLQEFKVIRFDPRIDSTISNKKRLIHKKRMVEILGTSPDIIDNFIMRIALDLDYQGDSTKGRRYDDPYSYDVEYDEETDDIFDFF